MPPKAKSKLVDELTFEQAFDEMEQIVHQLEDGQLALDESLALFERGQALSLRCQSLLETAELKVQQLVAKAGGGLELQSFEEEAEP